MSSGVQRMRVGAFTGSASAVNVRTVGFRPTRVELINITGLETATWQEGMADASMIRRITAGDMSLVSSNGITPLSDGFSIGADGNLNAAGELVRWVAFE